MFIAEHLRKSKIATQLVVWFLLIALLPLTIVSYVLSQSSENALTKVITDNLFAITERQVHQIEEYFREKEREVLTLSRIPAVSTVMEHWDQAPGKSKGNGAERATMDEGISAFLQFYQETSRYEDVLLISPEGTILFSVKSRADGDATSQLSLTRSAELARAFDRAKTLLGTAISDFEYNPETQESAAFIAAPVLKEGNFVGVVALQMSTREVYEVVNDYTGLGATGETFLATRKVTEVVFTTPPRHDPQGAMRRKIPIEDNAATPTQEAARGRKGSGITVDYRGKEVLAAWQYLATLGNGMVVKIDTDEAFAPIARLKALSGVIGVTTLFFVVFAALFVARSIADPIVKLTGVTELIAGGDLTQQATIAAKNEIGLLATSFNTMTRQLNESINNLRETTAAKERIESELKIAHDIQLSILPKIFPPFPTRSEFALHATIESAREVGGDFYDFFLIDDNHLWLAIGDVSGKGVPASLFMAATKTLLRAIAGRISQPEAILAELNNELCRDNDSGMFVTIFHGILHIPSGKLEYSNGGHNLPYVLSQHGTVAPLENPGGMALGVIESATYRAKTVRLRAGDGLFLYTDGVTEAMDSAGNLFSERRLQGVLQRANGLSPAETIQNVVSEVKRFAAGTEQSDDITTLAITYRGTNTTDEATMSEPTSVLFKNNLAEIERLGQVVAEFVESHQLPAGLTFAVNVALEEILTNIISYGYTDNKEQDILIRLSCTEGEVIAEVEDNGRPFNPLEVAEPDTSKPLEDRSVGGLGIHLARKLMDELAYRRQEGKNLLVLKKRIPAVSSPDGR